MSILDINNQLVNFFLSHEKFSLKEDLDKIKVNEDYLEYTEKLIVSSLNDLVNNNILVKLDDNTYLLKQPINNLSQEISISPNIASAIADKCNMFKEMSESTELDGDETNALNINQGDIVKLLIMIDFLLEDVQDSNDEDYNEQ